MNLKKIAAAVAILGALGLGVAAPAEAKPHHNDWCNGCGGGYYDGGYYNNWGGPWYPGKWSNGCVTGPYGHLSFCW